MAVMVAWLKPVIKLAAAQVMAAAATSVLETTGQLANESLVNKLNEWGADTSQDSFWGRLASNFQDNLGAGAQMATMQLSMGLTQSLVDPLEDAFQADMNKIRDGVVNGVNKAKNKVAKARVKGGFWNNYKKTTQAYQNRVKNSAAVVHAGAQFDGAYTQGAAGMEQAFNSKNLENINLQGMDPKELVKVVNQLLVAQKIG